MIKFLERSHMRETSGSIRCAGQPCTVHELHMPRGSKLVLQAQPRFNESTIAQT